MTEPTTQHKLSKTDSAQGSSGSQYRLLLSISLLSAAIVAYEIQLMHFFSIVQWHHFASMVISMALLGFGASGTLISLFRNWMLQRTAVLLPFLMISCGLLMTLVIRVSRSDFFIFDSYTLFVDGSQFLRLLGTYLLFFLPFFSGALAIGLIFVKKVERIGTFYFSDLLGAGLGGLLAIVLFWQFSTQEIPSIIAILPILAGGIIIRKSARVYLIGYSLISLSAIALHLSRPFELLPSQFKSISYALNLPDAKMEQEISSPYGLLQVVSSPAQRYAPGLSLSYTGTIPPSPVIFNNGNWYASIPRWSRTDTTHILNYTSMALPYALGTPKRVLLFDAGGGLELSQALIQGVEQITAIAPNPDVISLMQHEYASHTDSLFYHPKIKLHVQSPRTFLNQTRDSYDLIQLPLLGAFGGTVGLDALAENNLLTKEAFAEMWDKLSPDGMIVLSSWMDLPPKISLKVAALIAGSLSDFEIQNPLAHIIAVRSWATLTYVIRKTPFEATAVQRVQHFCERFSFDPVIVPGVQTQDQEIFNTLEDTNFVSALESLFTAQAAQSIRNSHFNIRPPTDNRPYFFQFLRWQSLPKLVSSLGDQRTAFQELGYLIAIVTLIQVLVLALVFILLPLFKLKWKSGHSSWVLLYFTALGFGYMFLEIVFINYFVLYLGQPMYSLATVISIMLISSGIGSYTASRYNCSPKTLLKITGIITAIILIYALGIGFFLSSTVGFPFFLKLLLAVIIIGLPAFFMGMPFPIGLKLVSKLTTDKVPWAWGINGCISVISIALATIIAVELGFMALLLFGALAYGIAFLATVFVGVRGGG